MKLNFVQQKSIRSESSELGAYFISDIWEAESHVGIYRIVCEKIYNELDIMVGSFNYQLFWNGIKMQDGIADIIVANNIAENDHQKRQETFFNAIMAEKQAEAIAKMKSNAEAKANVDAENNAATDVVDTTSTQDGANSLIDPYAPVN
jgi:hypothetical protein